MAMGHKSCEFPMPRGQLMSKASWRIPSGFLSLCCHIEKYGDFIEINIILFFER